MVPIEYRKHNLLPKEEKDILINAYGVAVNLPFGSSDRAAIINTAIQSVKLLYPRLFK